MSQLKRLASHTAIYGISSILGRLINYALVPLHTSVFARAPMGGIVLEHLQPILERGQDMLRDGLGRRPQGAATDLDVGQRPPRLGLPADEPRPGAAALSQSFRSVSDVPPAAANAVMLGGGYFTPLDGFMGEADWRGCCENMTLENGLFWPIPITLSCEQALGDSIEIGEDVALEDGETDDRALAFWNNDPVVQEEFSFSVKLH